MDLTLLRSLIAVADHGSVTEAASVIGLSQSALSRRLAQLDEVFGTPMLERVGRGAALTPLGKLVVAEGRPILERYQRLREQVQEHLALERGIVRVGGGATAVAFVLPKAIAAFRRRNPEVVFQVREAGSREIEAAVTRDELDLGIVTSPVLHPELQQVPWVRDEIKLVAAKQHPLAKKARVPLTALHGQNMIGFEAGSAIRRLIDTALRSAGVEVNVVMELRSVAAILRMVESTSSLAFVSELALDDRRPRGAVVAVPVTKLHLERQLVVVSRKDRTLSPAAIAFSATLLQPG